MKFVSILHRIEVWDRCISYNAGQVGNFNFGLVLIYWYSRFSASHANSPIDIITEQSGQLAGEVAAKLPFAAGYLDDVGQMFRTEPASL